MRPNAYIYIYIYIYIERERIQCINHALGARWKNKWNEIQDVTLAFLWLSLFTRICPNFFRIFPNWLIGRVGTQTNQPCVQSQCVNWALDRAGPALALQLSSCPFPCPSLTPFALPRPGTSGVASCHLTVVRWVQQRSGGGEKLPRTETRAVTWHSSAEDPLPSSLIESYPSSQLPLPLASRPAAAAPFFTPPDC